jgi:hypothetical protein
MRTMMATCARSDKWPCGGERFVRVRYLCIAAVLLRYVSPADCVTCRPPTSAYCCYRNVSISSLP